jgi:type VI secretion system ImpJ/VasE family protein
MSEKIHWQEGLFLQPHHLQRMQKGMEDAVASERRLAWPYPYGLIEARLSREELENKRVRFDKLRAIMPSGLEVNYPVSAELPSLDIAQPFSKGAGKFTVALGIPLWQNSRANTVPLTHDSDTRAKLLYRVGEIECFDENTGENPKPVQVRKINARLMLADEDPSDMEVLPLLRIMHATGEDVGLPKEDPEYVAPCMLLSGSPVLREIVRGLVNEVEASRKELVVQVTRGGFAIDTMRGIQFEQLMRLRTLNRYSARMRPLFEAPVATPFDLYLELRELLGELAALYPNRDAEFESSPYQHTELFECFHDLREKIRPLLRGVVAPSYLKLSFKDVGGVLTANFADEHFTQPSGYFLGIKSKLSPSALTRYVEDGDKFKLMPQSLATRAIRGVQLKEERDAPRELPGAADLHYFRLECASSARMWQQIQTEKTAAIRWADSQLDWADATFTLYMTVPSGTTRP